MRDQPSPNSRNIAGHAIGLDWAPRLSSLSLSKAQCIDWHSHNDTEVVICIKGSLDYEFHSTSPQKLHAGDALVIPPHCVHRLKDGVDGPSRRCSLFLRKRLPTRAGLALFSAAEYQRLMSRILDKRQIPCTIPGRKIYEAQRLADLIDRAPKLSALDVLEIRALVSSAVVTLSSAETVRRQPRSNNIVTEAQHWLLDRLSSKISVNDLVAHNVLSIVRELSVNAVRHGHATQVKVDGSLRDDVLQVSVRDNGRGFDAMSCPGPSTGHYGLEGIRARIRRLDGSFRIESEPGHGTLATFSIRI